MLAGMFEAVCHGDSSGYGKYVMRFESPSCFINRYTPEASVTGRNWPILLKKSTWFAHQKSMHPRLKFLLLVEASGSGFHVAASK